MPHWELWVLAKHPSFRVLRLTALRLVAIVSSEVWKVWKASEVPSKNFCGGGPRPITARSGLKKGKCSGGDSRVDGIGDEPGFGLASAAGVDCCLPRKGLSSPACSLNFEEFQLQTLLSKTKSRSF
jgi:hypothetical protein